MLKHLNSLFLAFIFLGQTDTELFKLIHFPGGCRKGNLVTSLLNDGPIIHFESLLGIRLDEHGDTTPFESAIFNRLNSYLSLPKHVAILEDSCDICGGF